MVQPDSTNRSKLNPARAASAANYNPIGETMLYTEREAAIDRQVDQAKRRAAETQRAQYVAEIDDGGEFGERSIIVCDDSYVCSGEFEAFDGQVLYEVGPSGDVY